MTRIVDGLERAGLAERRPDPADGRASLVRATAKGRRVMERGRRNRVAVIASLLADVPAADLPAIERAATVLERAMATPR